VVSLEPVLGNNIFIIDEILAAEHFGDKWFHKFKVIVA
jgi:hypothetical protein